MTTILKSAGTTLAALCLAAALAPTYAFAQGPLTALTEQIQDRAVVVTLQDGSQVKGRVRSVSDAAIVVGTADADRSVAGASIREIKRPGPIWDGAVKGAAIGGGIAALIGSNYNYAGQAALVGALYGGGIGIGIDALFGPKRIYRAPRTSAGISVSPLLGRTTGARVSVTF